MSFPYSTSSSPSSSTLSLSPALSTTAIVGLTTDDDLNDLPPPMYTSAPTTTYSYLSDYYDYPTSILHAPRMRFVPLPDEEEELEQDDLPPPPYDAREANVQVRPFCTYTPPSSTMSLPRSIPPSPASSTTAIVSLLTPSSSSSSSSARRRHANTNTYTPPHSHKPLSRHVQQPRREGGLNIIMPIKSFKRPTSTPISSKSKPKSNPIPTPSVTSSSEGYSYGFCWQSVDDLTPPPSPPRKRTKHSTNSTISRSSSASSSSSHATCAPYRFYVPLPY